MEREYIRIRLDENDWNISRTATLLGIERTNLHKKMRALGLSRDSQGHGRGSGPTRVVNRALLTVAGTLGFSAVLLGAFGAHGLRDRPGAADARGLPHRRALPPGARLAVLAVALAADRLRRAAPDRRRCSRRAIAIFSGSLYLLAITGIDLAGRGDAARRPAAARRLGGCCIVEGLPPRGPTT